jgi:GNAT superfamily N-acetyltransferase
MAWRTTRSEKLELRLTREAKLVLKAAAAASRCSVSEFVVESALARANEALADRRCFGSNATQGHPVPIMLLARLGVDRRWQGPAIGKALLKDAMLRTLQAADIAGIRGWRRRAALWHVCAS